MKGGGRGGWVCGWWKVICGKGKLPGQHKRRNQRVKVRRMATGERRPIPNFAGKTSANKRANKRANPLPLFLPRIPTLFQQHQLILRSWDRSPVAALKFRSLRWSNELTLAAIAQLVERKTEGPIYLNFSFCIKHVEMPMLFKMSALVNLQR